MAAVVTVTCEENKKLAKLLKQAMREPSKSAMEKTMKQAKQDIPKVVGKCVSEYYNVAAVECRPPQQKIKIDKNTGEKIKVGKKRAGKVYVTGDTLDKLAFHYSGRILSATRKSFKPAPKKQPKDRTEKYTVSSNILKSKTHTFVNAGVRYWLANGSDKRGNTQEDNIQLYRAPDKRRWGEVVHTAGIPAMIGTPEVYSAIQKGMVKKLNDLLTKNLERAVN